MCRAPKPKEWDLAVPPPPLLAHPSRSQSLWGATHTHTHTDIPDIFRFKMHPWAPRWVQGCILKPKGAKTRKKQIGERLVLFSKHFGA